MNCRLALLALATAALASQASAQGPFEGERPPATQALSVNPLYLPFGGFVFEYEAAVAPGMTLGVGAAYYDLVGGDDDTYSSAEVKLRFYPNERGPRGFSIGVSVGVGRTTEEGCCTPEGAEFDGETATGATTGVILDYNWLLGRSRRFFVGTGIGAKRLFGDLGEGDFLDIEVLPTARLQVGAAF